MDYFNKHVVLVTEKGDIQQTYKGEEGFVPQDIVFDGHSIYVADWYNHSVDELSHDGRHVRQLISGKQGLRLPKRICVDGTGNLYVAQGERATQQHVWILQKRKTPGHKLTVPSLHTKAGKSPMAPRPKDSASKLQTALSQNAKVGTSLIIMPKRSPIPPADKQTAPLLHTQVRTSTKLQTAPSKRLAVPSTDKLLLQKTKMDLSVTWCD